MVFFMASFYRIEKYLSQRKIQSIIIKHNVITTKHTISSFQWDLYVRNSAHRYYATSYFSSNLYVSVGGRALYAQTNFRIMIKIPLFQLFQIN